MISEVFSSIFEFISSLLSDYNDAQHSFLAYLFELFLSGWSYIFDMFIADFTSTIFNTFDYERIVFNGHLAIDSIFSFDNFNSSNYFITEHFLYFFVGLLVMVFVFKLFYKLFVDLVGIMFNALKSGLG